MNGKQHLESDYTAAGNPVAGNRLGLGLVLVGAAAAAGSAFLPLAQPVDGLPIIGNNTLFQILGWHVLWIPFFLPLFGYQASQGKRVARWSLIGVCAIAALGIVWLANDRSMRTLYLVGSGGVPDTSQPGLVTNLGSAIYVAGAGVAVAFIGALAFFQSAGKEGANGGPARQRRNGVRETRVPPVPAESPEPGQGPLEAESSAVEVESHAGEAQPRAVRSRLQSTWPLAAAIMVVVATVAGYFLLGRSSPTSQTSTTSPTPPSLTPAQAALEKLLLSPGQINTAMGMTGLTVGGTANAMVDIAADVPDKACQSIVSPAETKVYEGSRWSAVLGQELREAGPTFRHGVDQFVVSFPSAQDAGAFFAVAAQQWPACANRQYTIAMMGQNMVHTVGPVSDTDGILSVTHTQPHGDEIYTCQRALTVADNIVIDVAACSLNQFDSQADAAVNIAHQIAAKVLAGNNNPVPETNTGPTTAPLVAESALEGLLLSPDQISTAMGATGMTVTGPKYPTSTYNGSGLADKACQPLYNPAESEAYSDSRETAMFGQSLTDRQTSWPVVTQYVVLFASPRDASAFFATSAQRWPACSNRQFTYAESDGQQAVWTVGAVSNSEGILSATRTMTPYTAGNIEYTGKCQRALTVANNVAVDVLACSDSPDGTGVNIARQIAAKVSAP